MTKAALAGRRVAVTRARGQASALVELLRAWGADVVELPTIAIEPPESWAPLDEALGRLPSYGWLVVTSGNSARALAARLQLLGQAVPRPEQPRVAVVGPATASAMRQAGFSIDLEPPAAVSEALAEVLVPHVSGARVLLPRAEQAREVLPEALRAGGADVHIVTTHRTVAAQADAEALAAVLPTVEAITFTSSSSVGNLFLLLAQSGSSWPPAAKAVSIGPVTSGTLRQHGVEPWEEAAQHTLDGLVEAVLRAFARGSG